MRHLLMLVLLAALAPAAASAQATPPTDTIGMFFDEGGCYNCTNRAPFTTLNAYLLLVGPSAEGDVVGWECSIPTNPVSFPAGLTVTIAGGGINQAALPDLRVSLPTALPRRTIMILASLSTFYLGGQVYFGIGPAHPSSLPGNPAPAYFALPGAQTPRQLTTQYNDDMAGVPGATLAASVGGWERCEILIRNPWCQDPIAVEPSTWGTVKSLYGR